MKAPHKDKRCEMCTVRLLPWEIDYCRQCGLELRQMAAEKKRLKKGASK